MSSDNESIVEIIDDLDKDSKALKKSILELCWYMRGGVTLEEAWQLGFQDRVIINDIIKNNLEVTKESGLPFF